MSQPPTFAEAKQIVSIHQPHYFPWLGLIAKIACSDCFVYLDNVQFEKNGFQNRSRYSTDTGLKFLSLPVSKSGLISEGIAINEIKLAEPDASQKHLMTLKQRYGKCPGWKLLAPRLEAVLKESQEKLIPLCLATTALTLEIFRVKPKIVFSSDLPVPGQKSERVQNLVKAAGGDFYLSGTGAKVYLNQEEFAQAGIGLTFQSFAHPVYKQSTKAEFQSAAFALEWYLEEPDTAVETFHAHLRKNLEQPPRCLV